MQQPYRSNPECKHKDHVPLEKNERYLLLFLKCTYLIPLATLSLLGLIFAPSLLSDTESQLVINVLIMTVLLMLFVISLYTLFQREQYKEIFESEVTGHFGLLFLHWVTFKDKIGDASPMPFQYKVGRVKKGARYRIHKLINKDLILKIEDIAQ